MHASSVPFAASLFLRVESRQLQPAQSHATGIPPPTIPHRAFLTHWEIVSTLSLETRSITHDAGISR
jgi:hypothetical protein